MRTRSRGSTPMKRILFASDFSPADLWADARRAGQRGLDRLAKAARRDHLRVSVRLEAGPPAPAIVRSAKAERAGLVVIGTHGRTGLPRLLLGSGAERVVRLAPCPVLTVARHRR